MTVRCETDGPIAIVTIDRLDVANAVDAETAERLIEAFEKFDADPDLSVAILTGAGGKFSAGGDLRAMMEGRGITVRPDGDAPADRKSTRLNSSHVAISYAVFCLKKKKTQE